MFLLDFQKEFIPAPGVDLMHWLISDGKLLPESHSEYSSMDNNNKETG